MPAPTDATLEQGTVDFGLFHRMIHGGPSEEIETEGGEVPSYSKAIADLQEQFNAEGVGIVAQASTLLGQTQQASNDAAASAAQAAVSVATVGGYVQQALQAAGATVNYNTLAQLNTDLLRAAGTLGGVYSDPTQTNNGVYQKQGAYLTIGAASNGLNLPQATITLVGTMSQMSASGSATVVTASGNQTVNYTGISGQTITGCTGGTGAMSTGGSVTQGTQSWAQVQLSLAQAIQNEEQNRLDLHAKGLTKAVSFGTAAPVAGANGTSDTYVLGYPVPADGYIKTITLYGQTAGTIKVKRFTLAGGTFTFANEISLTITAGLQTLNAWSAFSRLDLSAGDYLAIYNGSGKVAVNTANNLSNYYLLSGDVTTTAAQGSLVTATRLEAVINLITKPYSVTQNASDIAVLNETVQAANMVSDVAIVNTSISNPSTRFATLLSPGAVTITQSQASVMLVGQLLAQSDARNKLIQVDATFTGSGSNTGFGILINPSGQSTIDPTNAIALIWRASNGSLVAYRQDGTASIGSVGLTAIQSGAPWGDAENLSFTLLQGGDPTIGTVRMYKIVSGVPAQVGEYTLTGLTAGYFGSVARQVGPGASCTLNLSVTSKQDKSRAFYINGAASPGGNGTEANPFSDLNSAIRKVKESPGSLEILLRGGVFRGSIQLPANKYRKVRISGLNGEDTIIRGSTLRTSGWTKTAGATNVWERPHRWQGVEPSSNTGGAIIDVTPANIDSTRPHQWRIYTRLAPNVGVATLDAAAMGSSMVDTVAQKMYVHPYNNTDPNTLSLEVADQQNPFSLFYGASTDNYYCDLTLENLHAQYGYGSGFLIQRAVDMRLVNLISEGAGVGYGFSLNDSCGQVYGANAIGNYADGFNGTVTTGSPLSRIPKTHFWDCFASYGSVIGAADGFSNHSGHDWYLHGGGAFYNGKDGVVPASGDCYLFDFVAKGNIDSQIYIAGGGNGKTSLAFARAHGCVVDGLDLDGVTKHLGFHCEAVASGPSRFDIHGGRASNCSQALKVFNTSGTSADCVMNAYNVKDGGGNTALKQNSGGVMNVYSDSTIT